MTAICDVPYCARPSSDFVCSSCIDVLKRALDSVPDLVVDVDDTLSRQSKAGNGDARRGAETPLPYDYGASEASWVLRNTLTTWVRHLAEPRGLVLPPDGLAEVALWLGRYLNTIRTDEAGGQLVDEVLSAISEARRATDRRPDTRTYLGRCDLNDPENPECDKKLYAHRHDEMVSCTCGAEWVVSERREWLLSQVEDEVRPAPDVATLLTSLGKPITVSQIHRYARAGELVPARIDPHRRRLYRVGAVLDLFMGEPTR